MARSTLDVILNFKEQGNKKALKNLRNMVAAMGGLTAAAVAFRKAWDLAEQGAQLKKFEQGARSMAKSVGQDMDSIVDSLQQATQGALDQATAMEVASRAIKLGVAETPEEFAKLADAATNLGAAMGRGPVDAINDIVTGIGRMSPLILDNIGIVTNGGQVFEDYAASIGKSADEMSDAEKKQALFSQAVEDGAKLSNDMVSSFEKLEASTKDIADALRKELARELGPIAERMNTLAQETLAGAEAYNEFNRMAELGILSLEDQAQIAPLLSGDLEQIEIAVRLMNSAWVQYGMELLHVEDRHEAIKLGLIDLRNEAEDPAEPSIDDSQIQQDMTTLGEIIREWANDLRRQLNFRATLRAQEEAATPGETLGGGGGPGTSGLFQQHGGTFTVPPGFPRDSFPFRVSSGEQVNVSNRDSRSFFSGSNVNINNGTDLEAFEEILRQIQ